ncbi:MAG TPA: WYL domain-containing protein [Acidimicrobiia bacterium]|nr:WYL domain-containing protein [Acidimicrobiia bacterium]
MADRFERLANLVACLLDTPRPLSLEEIVDRVPGYPPDKASYRRQFERDKDALRGLGIPVTVEQHQFADEEGYRVHRSDYELPELDLTAEERAALHTAVTAVQLEGGEGREALWKLGGLGGEEAPTLGAIPSAPQLPALVEASRRRAPVGFTYRGKRRTVDPYVVLFRDGNWYVLGHDHDAGEVRAYRADRIEGGLDVGADDAFTRPDGFDPAAMLHDEPWRYGAEPPVEALVQVDGPAAGWVVQRLGHDAVVESDGDRVVVRFTVTNREAFRSFVVGLLDHAVVLEPADLRAEVVEWLTAVAGGAR